MVEITFESLMFQKVCTIPCQGLVGFLNVTKVPFSNYFTTLYKTFTLIALNVICDASDCNFD